MWAWTEHVGLLYQTIDSNLDEIDLFDSFSCFAG